MNNITSLAGARDVIIILLYGLLFTGLVVLTHSFFTPVVQIEMAGSQTDNVQVFFDEGPGFREQNVDSKYLRSDGLKEKHVFRSNQLFAFKTLRKYRIDPRTSEGPAEIYAIELRYRFQRIRLEGSQIAQSILRTHHIGTMVSHEDHLALESTGIDPFLVIQVNMDADFTGAHRFQTVAIMILLWSLLTLLVFVLQKADSYIPELPDNWTNKITRGLTSLIFYWFIFQMIFFAMQIEYRVPPDEIYHDLVSTAYFEANGFNIQDQPETYHLGTVAKRAYLYHLIMGKLMHLKWTGFDHLLYLRLLNILISIGTLFVSLRLVQELTPSKWVQLTVIAVQSNLLMYVFLASMVSYDNLTNLLAVLATLFLFRYLKREKRLDLMCLIIVNALGLLTKISFAPICLIYSLIICAHLNKSLWSVMKGYIFEPKNRVVLFAFALLIVTLGLNVRHYGSNLINYGRLEPFCYQVLPAEACAQWLIVHRNTELKATLESRDEVEFGAYLVEWSSIMFGSIFGVLTHQTLEPPLVALPLVIVLLLSSFFLAVLQYKQQASDKRMWILLIIVGYTFFVFRFGYSNYVSLREIGIAVQGRYLFPVITLMLFSAISPLFWWGNRTVKLLISVTLVWITLQIGFPYFLANAGAVWYKTL